MSRLETLKFELHSKLDDLLPSVGKTHVSVRWEPGARIVRVGVSIDEYDWGNRLTVLRRLLDFEESHKEEFALEFDILPLVAIEDDTFAQV